MTQKQLEGLTHLRELLLKGDTESLKAFLNDQHEADVAEWLEELTDEEREMIFGLMEAERAAEVLGELELETQADVITDLDPEKAGDILDEMPTDEAADLLAELTPEEQGEILDEMEAEEAADVRELLEHDPDTAGGIMTTDYITVQQEMTAQEAIEHLRDVGPEAETIYYVYVVDFAERLVGVLSLRDLIVAPPYRSVREIMRTKVLSVYVDQDQEEVAKTVSKYDLMAIPVIDRENRLMGVITVDDVIDVLEEEATEDALRMSAVTPDTEDPGATDFGATIWKLVKPRLPWLIALLFLEVVSGKVVEHFQSGIPAATLALLTIFITTMAGEAGNAATQALAVVVRSLATGEIETKDVFRVVWRELRVGAFAGVLCGIVLAGLSYAMKGNLALSLVVGLAIAINIPVAKIMGAFFPILITRFGIDPAVASGPFITTVTDVTSMLTYFGIATLILLR
ncbi:MAG TPA: magnesium transporter [Symbiobacteriaceae bacterium]|nr:magnesium transporter [Symbiobacteriaceae bacterium]